MATYEVETGLIIHTIVKVTVNAKNNEDAIDTVANMIPKIYEPELSKLWKAKVDLEPPRGVNCRVVKAYRFEQATGGEKARKVTP